MNHFFSKDVNFFVLLSFFFLFFSQYISTSRNIRENGIIKKERFFKITIIIKENETEKNEKKKKERKKERKKEKRNNNAECSVNYNGRFK